MTAVDKLITSVRKHMEANRSRRRWGRLKNWEEEISHLADEAYEETSTSDGFVICPVEWAGIVHNQIGRYIRSGLEYDGRTYQVTRLIKDGDHCKSARQLVNTFVVPAAKELADVMGAVEAQPQPYLVPVEANIATASDDRYRIRVSAFYDSKTSGTRITYAVEPSNG